jgi:hypothetical protein
VEATEVHRFARSGGLEVTLMKKGFAAFCGLVLAAGLACSGSGPGESAAPAWTPVGTWSFTTVAQGQTVDGVITISGSEGMYTGMIDPEPSSGIPPLPVSTAELTGNEMLLTADAGGIPLTLTMIFDGDSYSGGWTLSGDGGEVSGVRIN